jgi:hypothetical protein
LKDITGKEIVVGDWVFYGVKHSTSIEYSFAKIILVRDNILRARKVIKRFNYKEDKFIKEVRVVQLYNAPLIIIEALVPQEIRDFLLVTGLRKE